MIPASEFEPMLVDLCLVSSSTPAPPHTRNVALLNGNLPYSAHPEQV